MFASSFFYHLGVKLFVDVSLPEFALKLAKLNTALSKILENEINPNNILLIIVFWLLWKLNISLLKLKVLNYFACFLISQPNKKMYH